MHLPECPGCAERREKMARFAERFAEWAKHPFGPMPVLDSTPEPVDKPEDKK